MAACYWGTQLQIARRLVTVASRWSWFAIGGAVFLWNATTGARRLIMVASRWWGVASGGAVLLRKATADC